MEKFKKYTEEELSKMDKEELVNLALELRDQINEMQAKIDKKKKQLDNIKALNEFMENPSAVKKKSKLKAPLRDP